MNKTTGRELPLSTVRLVAALCGDYPRMKEALRRGKLSHRTEESYATYTTAIYEETARAVGLVGCQAEELILDMAKNRGYRASALNSLIGRGRYNRAKARALHRIAVRLFLIEE